MPRIIGGQGSGGGGQRERAWSPRPRTYPAPRPMPSIRAASTGIGSGKARPTPDPPDPLVEAASVGQQLRRRVAFAARERASDAVFAARPLRLDTVLDRYQQQVP